MITKAELEAFAELTNKLYQSEQILFVFQYQNVQTDCGINTMDVSDDDIMELEAECASLRAQLLDKQQAVEKYITATPVAQMRVALRLHYIRGLSWKETAQIACYISEDALKAASDRNYRKYKQTHSDAVGA